LIRKLEKPASRGAPRLRRSCGDSSTTRSATPAREFKQKERPSLATPRLNVLVAEDNEINGLLATRTLERLGCEPVWVRDGRQALTQIEASLAGTRSPFDLALLDIRMPELDGLAAARAIRAAEARAGSAAPLPLIAVTANVSPSDRAAALAAGMDDCLAKPIERAALARWLQRVEARPAEPLSA
jgi:CheY-like chemotaxis protein